MQTIRYILIADVLLLLAAFFTDRFLLLFWPGRAQFTLNEKEPFWRDPLTQLTTLTGKQWVVLITPALALLMARYAHERDDEFHGRGVKDIITKDGKRRNPYNLETDVIAASMTKQSVLAAIAAILVVVIQQLQGQAGFSGLVTLLATIGFAFAILFLLVSMVCYDYASRFRWRTFYKAQLVRKALLLDVSSWYILLTSFILSIALISPWLSILTCFTSGILMWWYYFFPKEKPGDALAIQGIARHTLKVKNLASAKAFYGGSLGLEVFAIDDKRLCLRIGNWSEITLVEDSSAGDTPQSLTLTMAEDDLRFASDTLTRNKVSHTIESRRSIYGIELKVISFKDPDNAALELCTPTPDLRKVDKEAP